MNTYYFSHDYNARTDTKIKQLIRKQGMCGYGLYWALVEDLYNNDNSLPLDLEGLAYEYRIDTEAIRSVLRDFDLFCIDKDVFSSLSVKERLEMRNNKSNKARDNANKRWNKTEDANAMPPHSKRNAIKEKKVKEKIYREFDHLSISQKEFDVLAKKYTKEQVDGILDNICNFAGNKKYKSLYLTATNWLKKEKKPQTLRQSIGL